MKYLRRVLLTGVLCLGPSACSDVFRDSYDYSEVTVVVTDSAGNPVADANMTLYSPELHLAYGRTRVDGTYRFERVTRGTRGVEVGAPPGYRWPHGATSYRLFEVERGEDYLIDFELLPPQ